MARNRCGIHVVQFGQKLDQPIGNKGQNKAEDHAGKHIGE